MTEQELKEKMDKDLNEVFNVKNIIDFQFDLLQKAYTKGLETGLKAGRPQWHKVVDGDLPKDEKDRLLSDQLILLTKMKGTNNLSISIGQYNFSTQEFNYQHIVGLTDVIAWKEIVLPELPKEIEIRSNIFPEITLPEESAEFVDKIISDAEKRLKESE